MLAARHAVGDRDACLEAGADDYLIKPYGAVELIARVRALLRRSSLWGANELLRFDDLTLDPAGRYAIRGSRHLTLAKTEPDLLEF